MVRKKELRKGVDRLKMQLVMAENKESQIGTPDPLTMT